MILRIVPGSDWSNEGTLFGYFEQKGRFLKFAFEQNRRLPEGDRGANCSGDEMRPNTIFLHD